jgi:hypothetical protein
MINHVQIYWISGPQGISALIRKISYEQMFKVYRNAEPVLWTRGRVSDKVAGDGGNAVSIADMDIILVIHDN